MKKDYIVDTYKDVESKLDGNHIIAPALAKIGAEISFVDPNDRAKLALFNNEANDIAFYNIDLQKGLYFTEVLGPLNKNADEYRDLIETTLLRVRGFYEDGAIPFERISELGRSFEEIDFTFAESHIGIESDAIHSICGPNPSHPYAKNTIFRTVIDVRTSKGVERLFLEKFLTNYTYLDGDMRKSTITPIHGHPPNFEVAYFGHYGAGSKAIEQEFVPLYKSNAVIKPDDSIDEQALHDPEFLKNVHVIPGPIRTISPSEKPLLFPAQIFDSAVMSDRTGFFQFSGVFRPHRVTVVDDAYERTVFHSLITYISRDGRVNMFTNDGRPEGTYSHKEWGGSDIT